MSAPTDNSQSSPKILPLHAFHERAGAKFGVFAGWQMPLTYPMGVMNEHLHTRAKAGLFDISHMKMIEASGDDVIEFLDFSLPLDAASLAIGQSRYNYLLNEKAGILDDLIITRLGDKRFMLVVNAGNAQSDYCELKKRAQNFSCDLLLLERVILALQGPKASQILQNIGLKVEALSFMQAKEFDNGLFIARSGYTGEDGFELALPLEQAAPLVERLLQEGDVEWIGLGARDSLRLEAGLCLHGNDISINDSPAQAGLLWAVPKSVRENKKFIGAQALAREIENGITRRRVGLKILTKQPVRAGAKLYAQEEAAPQSEIGYVTSGGFGPTIQAPIAMGYVKTEYAQMDRMLYALVRDKKIPVILHKLPFVPQNYAKP